MKKVDSKKKAKDEDKSEHVKQCDCPYCTFKRMLTVRHERNIEFWKHIDNAQIEILEACRALINKRIDQIKEKECGDKKELTKIEIREE